ncbi:PdxA family dehydrogenase [Noviherbaspirillum pedocola]|uniref:4-hydroxythreonine-4-phosphate dehydrogenase PdxA n=1 Tax=Noviherbaspirillum pedocola TaxID=2801341 RepID=A0A934T0W6_9BURK|nr:4-hydroxythreonine-4-phosphate dehydrogenase PdxA [Noviherbaspirillum pedocola]MBK4738681.1 4-hydroxythreonine-4-phosphate dehydrogenase PdxA [Noviherbaspirillum pedocola]
MKKRIAVAIGDPNGIGPEIAVKAAAQTLESNAQAVLVGDEYILRECLRRYAPGVELCALDEADRADGCIAHVDIKALDPTCYQPGKVDAAAGRATVAYVSEAVRLAQAGRVDAVIGCPHSETAVNAAGIAFTGYPGLIAQLCGRRKDEVFLMLSAAGLRIAHVTLHESVRNALARLTPELVVAAGAATATALRRLGIAQPTLGVFGINPHAGEDGLFGDEDETITKPAVARLRTMGIAADGPTGADLLLGQRRHDAYLAIFHDQGHIPVKLLSPLRASALSIGADVLFSSVGHGSAFDIAGRGIADPASVIETLALLATATVATMENRT